MKRLYGTNPVNWERLFFGMRPFRILSGFCEAGKGLGFI